MPEQTRAASKEDYQKLSLDLGARGYDILVGEGLLKRGGELVKPLLKQPRTIIITDDNVADLHLATLEESFKQASINSASIVLPHGEKTKKFSVLETLVEEILSRRIERKTTLIALGGGVIGDITGFAASIILRGIDFIQMPTTLLAQVDSSVGGKTGINSDYGKNLIGAFYQPRLVLIDIQTLKTLPPRELLAGYAETVKYALIGDPEFFAHLEKNAGALIKNDTSLRTEAIMTACRAKAEIVARDEKESGRRALLNLGHTFAHALEAQSGYGGPLLHGEAVSIGMVMAFDLSLRLGLAPASDLERIIKHFKDIGLPTDLTQLPRDGWRADDLLAHMSRDKKMSDGRITFVLARGIGQAFLTREVDGEILRQLLDDNLQASHSG